MDRARNPRAFGNPQNGRTDYYQLVAIASTILPSGGNS